MPDLADLYPGFASRFMPTSIGTIFVRTGGTGPPLLLLHGYPQTNVIYHRVAPRLAQGFTLVIPDLPGYGWSAVPRSDADHSPYTKRAMAAVMIELMEALGFVRFRIAGHDRGGRVAYRLALDHPERVERLAALDILPTYDYWQRMDRQYGLKMYHWLFLAQPEPLPERLIGGNPVFNVDHTLASWTKAQSLAAFDPRALAHYRAALADPSRIHAACEDYRAGAHADYDHDAADRAAGRRIAGPVLALWGAGGLSPAGDTPLDVWREWASDVRGTAIDSGHFLAEEAPDATAAALAEFFAA
ncbi:MAG: alpha/beta hydrolase [Xanthobacteraceae bacterium]